MARKDPDPPLELDPLKGGLKHNPFAALRGTVEVTGATPLTPTPPRPNLAPAPPQARITVRLERSGRGGKAVTIAEGPGLAGCPLDPLARDIARGMGTGARVEGATVVVQGDQRERLVHWFAERGYFGAVSGN